MDCSQHKGHKRYIGGVMDGQISHLIYAHPSDYPQTFGTVLHNGSRSWYEIDYEASEGTEVVYRCIGLGKDFPVHPAAEAKTPESAKPEAPDSSGNSSGSLPAESADQPATQPGYPAAEAKGQDAEDGRG